MGCCTYTMYMLDYIFAHAIKCREDADASTSNVRICIYRTFTVKEPYFAVVHSIALNIEEKS